MSGPAYLLLHGAWAGNWVWDRVAPQLQASGHLVVAPDLPGGGPEAVGKTVTVEEMVDHAIAALPETGGPWIVVGHSGGGIIATMVAERLVSARADRVVGLVYLAGMVLPSGMSFPQACTIAGSPPPQGIEPYLQPTSDGQATFVPPEAAVAIFFQCTEPADAIAAARRLHRQGNASWKIVPSWAAEGAGIVPRLYIEALQDRSMPIAVQRTMQRLVPGARIAKPRHRPCPAIVLSQQSGRGSAQFCKRPSIAKSAPGQSETSRTVRARQSRWLTLSK